MIGDIVHVKALSRELPGIITDELDDFSVNLVVFTDGIGEPKDPSYHMVKVQMGFEVGEFHWPEDCNAN